MAKVVVTMLMLVLSGCAAAPQQADSDSPCAGGESSYACQVHRYGNVGMP